MAQKGPPIPRRYVFICFRCRTHSRKLRRQHDEEKLMSCLRQQDELFCFVSPPAGRDCDSIFLVDGMAKLAGIKAFGWRIVVHVVSGVFIHSAPLDTTFNHLALAGSIKNFSLICAYPPQP